MARASAVRAALTAFLLVAAAVAGCSKGDTGKGGRGAGAGAGGSVTCPPFPASSPSDARPECHACMAKKCAAELAACDDECIAIQACLDSVCFHLSATGATDEGACQAYCQGLHFAGKRKHLAVVNCAISTAGAKDGCRPPCAGDSFDFDQCHAYVDSCTCKPELDACGADQDCTHYQLCSASCGTSLACSECSNDASGKKGRALFERYWACVEQTCLLQAWIPSL